MKSKSWKNNVVETANVVDEEFKQGVIREFIKFMKGLKENENSGTNEKTSN
jgi:hypothetical protein